MPPDHVHLIEQATDLLTAHRAATEQAERDWRKAITDALAAGESATVVAEAAGISRARVYQLRDGKR